jgi:hypothetical protein
MNLRAKSRGLLCADLAIDVLGIRKQSVLNEINDANKIIFHFYRQIVPTVWTTHGCRTYGTLCIVYVDESGCDKRIGFRRTGWSPLSVAPVQVSQFHRDERIKYSQRMPKMVSCFPAFFVVQQMPVYSKIFSTSFFDTVEDGRSRNPFWSWIMHRFTTLNVLHRCVLMLESSSFTYLLIHRTLIQLRNFLLS